MKRASNHAKKEDVKIDMQGNMMKISNKDYNNKDKENPTHETSNNENNYTIYNDANLVIDGDWNLSTFIIDFDGETVVDITWKMKRFINKTVTKVQTIINGLSLTRILNIHKIIVYTSCEVIVRKVLDSRVVEGSIRGHTHVGNQTKNIRETLLRFNYGSIRLISRDDNTKAHRLAQIAITIGTKIKLKMPNEYV